MKINNLLREVYLSAASIVATTLLGLVISSTPVHAAGNTCTWVGGTSGNWSAASNWTGCGGGVPQNGDSLIFDSTGLSSVSLPNNDLSNLNLDNITIQGSGAYTFGFEGNAFSLSGGITNTSSSGAIIFSSITLTASQTFSSSSLLDISGTNFTMGSYNLNALATSAGEVDIHAPMSGTGTLTFDSQNYTNFINSDNPNFSGPLDIHSGMLIINASNTNQLGTGNVTIDNGSTLQESINSNGTYSIANPITVAGNGANIGAYGYGALIVHGYSATGTVNFTGPITLADNTTVGLISGNVGIAGSVSGCGYSISKASGASGTLSGNLTGSCPASSSSTSSSTSDPGAPSTGFGEPASHSWANYILPVAAIVSIGCGALILTRCRHNTKNK